MAEDWQTELIELMMCVTAQPSLMGRHRLFRVMIVFRGPALALTIIIGKTEVSATDIDIEDISFLEILLINSALYTRSRCI